MFAVANFSSLSLFAQLNINRYLIEGQQELQSNNFTNAISIFNKVIESSPENHQAFFFRGVAKLELGDKLGAEADFKQTTLIHHGYSPAFYYLGIVQTDQKDYYDAISNFDKAIAINSINSDYLNARGFAKAQIGDSVNALKDFNEALKIDPANINAYLNRSIMGLESKKYTKALQDCNSAIGLMPEFFNAYILRGQIKLFMKDSLGALKDFEYTISKDSNNAMAYYYMAGYYHDKNNFEPALRNYAKVIALDPYNAECYYNRATLYAQHDHFAEANTDYTKVIALNPKNLFAYFYRANVRERLKDYQGAIDDYSTVISLYPTFYNAYYLRSLAYREVKNYKAYATDKRIAEMLMTNNDSIHYSPEEITSNKKLFELRSEFENNDTAQGKIQFKPYEIIMKTQFNIILARNDAVKEYQKFNPELEQLNTIKPTDCKMMFSLKNTDIDVTELLKERSIIDSLVRTDSLSQMYQFWKSIISGAIVNYSQALNSVSKISDTSNYSYLIWFVKGNLHFAMGQKDENDQLNNQLFVNKNTTFNTDYYMQAIQDYTVAIEKNNKFSPAYYNRAYAKGVLNDYRGAILDYSVSIFYDNSFAEAYYNRGVLYLFLGDKELGCKDISKAGELGIKESYNLLYKYCDH